MFFFTVTLVLFSCKHQHGFEDPYQEGNVFIGSVSSLFVCFSAVSTLHLKRYRPGSFTTQKLIAVFFSCLVNLFISSVYLLLHSSHSPLHLLCLLMAPYLCMINMNATKASFAPTLVSFLRVPVLCHKVIYFQQIRLLK